MVTSFVALDRNYPNMDQHRTGTELVALTIQFGVLCLNDAIVLEHGGNGNSAQPYAG